MKADRLQKIISGNWVDIDTKKTIKLDLKKVVIKSGARKEIDVLINEIGGFKKILVVSDVNTKKAAGQEFFKLLNKKFDLKEVVLKNGVEPEIKICEKIIKAAKGFDFILAVGSGTINDICKYSSFKLRIPYAVFATAASMNGYASSTASIKIGKFKTSLKAKLPAAIIVDLDVIKVAPKRLIASGFGDLMCRPSCQIDWFLSKLLVGTEFKNAAFDITKDYEKWLLKNFNHFKKNEPKALEILMKALITSGISMHISGGSMPASQSEHLIAHNLEMLFPAKAKKLLHGELVALTTLYSLALQNHILKEKPEIKIKNISKSFFVKTFGKAEGSKAFAEYQAKIKELKGTQNKLRNLYKKLEKEFQRISIDEKVLRKMFGALSLPINNKKAGFTDKEFEKAAKTAGLIRNRFTFLDIDFLRG